MTKRIYNFIWNYPLVREAEVHVAKWSDHLNLNQKEKMQALIANSGIDAVIIYPSLLTPEIFFGNDDLEILLLAKDRFYGPAPFGKKDENDTIAFFIDKQLKITEGLNVMKPYLLSNLIKNESKSQIEIKDFDVNDVISGKYFSGIIDKRVIEFYGNQWYKRLKLVNIKIDGTLDNLNILTSDMLTKKPAPTNKHYLELNKKDDSGEIQLGENQDKLIRKLLKEIHGKGLPLNSFMMNEEDIDVTKEDFMCPIQAYHPLVYDDGKDYFDFMGMADIHLSARQSVLAKTTARVIEPIGDPLVVPLGRKKIDILSPEIGSMMNNHTCNFMNILNQINNDKKDGQEEHVSKEQKDVPRADAIILAGDLVDVISDVYLGEAIQSSQYQWEIVKVSNDNTIYKNYVNYIILYSILMNFYQRTISSKKPLPIFGVIGNHDPYAKPWGISPRALNAMRLNPGIPADHNLTFYEATLAFGSTYHANPYKDNPANLKDSNLDPHKFIWYHLVLSPLSDYLVHFSKQILVGLSWGDSEDLFQSDTDRSQGFGGHLPRADGAISDKQLKLIDSAIDQAKSAKKIILASHFTFISFKEDVPSYIHGNPVTAKIAYETNAIEQLLAPMVPTKPLFDALIPRKGTKYNMYNMGTFEHRKTEIFRDRLSRGKSIQCVFTGHSHRGMLYKLGKCDATEMEATAYEFDKYDRFEPVIVVTDSAGPLPRLNKQGEFGGWGSYYPSGTLVVWDKKDGTIDKIQRVESTIETARPRIAVAIDYYDIMEEKVIKEFRSYTFDNKQMLSGGKTELPFSIRINEKLLDWGIKVERVVMSIYIKGDKGKLPLIAFDIDSITNGEGSIRNTKLSYIYNSLINKIPYKLYLSLFFANANKYPWEKYLAAYNFDHSWNIEAEIEVKRGESLDRSYYVIRRSSEFSEHPDFEKRKSGESV